MIKRDIEPKDETLEQQNERLKKGISERDSMIEKLTNELYALRRRLFGHSSERFVPDDPNQLSLAFEGLESLPEEQEITAQETVITYKRKKEDKKQPIRKAIPDSIRREEVVIEPENIPEGAIKIGEEVTEKIEYNPGEVYVLRTIRPKYALPLNQSIVIADLPTQVLPRSNAGASMLAFLLVSKYQDHLPFYRILEILKRQNITISASTVNGWCIDTLDLLKPLLETHKNIILGCDYIQVDESTITVMDKDKPGGTKKGYFWIVKSVIQNQLFFHYQQGSRAQKVVVELLRTFKGAVQCDAYGAYDIYENKNEVLLLGCMAHARRKFEQALNDDPQKAKYALEIFGDLYDIERYTQENKLSYDEIKQLRREKSYPILQAFEKWLDENCRKVLPKSLIGKAILYTYNVYPRLVRYVLDGRYKIDNNGAENGVRPLALGRKNYMFCGNDAAAERTALIYSLLGSCKLAGINPTVWLTDVLNRIQDHSVLRLSELLPTNWKPLK
ncbi:MAG: IS66 family transposase [Mariniphaga sp.]